MNQVLVDLIRRRGDQEDDYVAVAAAGGERGAVGRKGEGVEGWRGGSRGQGRGN